ncbi:TetR/AcrR family transcriptional regulator C-terminal domain-containing protein [Marinibaculum pumilum]|uniref:TetR/AcrR family transcriptional regulator C-terminal domain-containing protein n=1 Tax=Marinibaculum pumilum TaxID=1766165 RepID=A0ABV7KZP1_9PROT
MPGRRKLQRRQIQQAALDLVDRDGLHALSMRSLARELGTGTMTLYGYVADRAALDALVVAAVLDEAGPMPADDAMPGGEAAEDAEWRARAAVLALAAWRAICAHPNAIPLILTVRLSSGPALAHGEALLAALAGSGLRGEGLLAAFRAVNGFIVGQAQVQTADLRIAVEKGAPDAAIASAMSLDLAQFPHLREIAAAAAQTTPEAQFRAGLRLVLDGVAAAASVS